MDLIACLRSGLRLEADALGRPISVAALDRAIRRSWWALQHAGAPKGSPNRGDSAWRLVPHDASLRRACDAVSRSRKDGDFRRRQHSMRDPQMGMAIERWPSLRRLLIATRKPAPVLPALRR